MNTKFTYIQTSVAMPEHSGVYGVKLNGKLTYRYYSSEYGVWEDGVLPEKWVDISTHEALAKHHHLIRLQRVLSGGK